MTSQQKWVAFCTIVRKEVVRFMRIWTQTLLPPAITMSLYFVVFGVLLGERIQKIGEFSYIEFIVPGLIMMSVITNSFSNVASSFFSSKFQRSVEELLVSPVPDWLIISAYVVGGASRGILVGCVVLLVPLFLPTFRSTHSLSYFSFWPSPRSLSPRPDSPTECWLENLTISPSYPPSF